MPAPTGGVVGSFKTKVYNSHQQILIFLSKFCKYLHKFSPETSRFHKFCSANYGGILIEFAFSVPIIIALLFFINDHYRFYELKDKVKSSAYLFASMIQQITNNRTDKQISMNDIRRMLYASCLNLFHTNSAFTPSPFGILLNVCLYHVKRISNDSYQFQAITVHTDHFRQMQYENVADSIPIRTWSYSRMIEKCPSLDRSDMAIDKDGDEKLLIECFYVKDSSYSNKKLGFLILKPVFSSSTRYIVYRGNFAYRIVITPKPGLFPVENG
ncbi:MAG: hypothetical protein IJT36_07450 [Alphaproteobacteria bacterium]|nr:hypothetical protein [Alphaproteobacteria bacterium]